VIKKEKANKTEKEGRRRKKEAESKK